jgi:hypothetical protein
VLPCPAGNLFGLTIRSAVGVLPPSIAVVEEALIVAFELVVENESANLSTTTPQALVGALIRPIHLGVVRELTGLPDAGIERLAEFVAAVRALEAVRFEQISAALRQDDDSVV